MLKATLHKKTFHFRFDARTSRGIMKDRVSWFIRVVDTARPDVAGIGEVAPLAGLSPELTGEFESTLEPFVQKFNAAALELPTDFAAIQRVVSQYFPEVLSVSSILFALETALLDLINGGERIIFRNSFLTGKPIPINGLIWMGGMDFMLQQIEIKIRDGFRCIKLKVGGLDFEKECDVLQYVRRKYFRDNITIRLDANGAFKADDALYKLNELARFNIHSIEQPLKKGSEHLPELCVKSPIPIVLDEELLGVPPAGRGELLDRVKPQYLIVKPGLHGGLSGSGAWIAEAEKRGIGWWATSALESNIGLNAIAQFVSEYQIDLPQGLGTGALYDDNFEGPLEVLKTGELALNPRISWDVTLDS